MEESLIVSDEELMKLVEEYTKTKGNSFIVMPMEDRVKLFLGCVKDCDYRKESFVNVKDFKNLFFPNDQLEKINIKDLDEYFTTFVVGEKATRENRLVVLYNKEGVKNNKELSDDNTLAYEISFKNNEINQTTLKDLKSKLIYDSYSLCKCKNDEKEKNALKASFKKYLTQSRTKQA